MTADEIRILVAEFLNLLRAKPGAVEDDEGALKLLLDRLALATHYSEAECDDSDYPEPPERNYTGTRKTVEAHFPRYGYYNVMYEVAGFVENPKPVVGDAIDDIADIALDLGDVSWRFENTSNNDALWHFSLLYNAHWGRHLRDLQLYLHDFEHGD